MAVIVLLLGLFLPALVSRKGSQDVTTAAYNVAGALATARNYAMANNTYTWIGFYEQDYGSTATPGAAGVGHVTIGIVYSKDGTKLVDDTTAGSKPLPPTDNPNALGQVGKLMQIYGIHLKPLATPPTTVSAAEAEAGTSLNARPYPTDTALLNSESGNPTSRPVTAQGYTFTKTIRFNPRGEANFNSTLPCARIIEIGLQPTHGNAADSTTPNLVAVQQTGIGGAVTIYRP